MNVCMYDVMCVELFPGFVSYTYAYVGMTCICMYVDMYMYSIRGCVVHDFRSSYLTITVS